MPSDIWTAPADWTTNEVVTAAKLNQQLRDDLYALWLAITSSSTSVTPSTRTRKMPLSVRSTNSSSLNGGTDWPDAVTSNCALVCPLPVDWVSGTDIVFMAGILQTATAGGPLWIYNSDISAELLNVGAASGVSFSDTNLEAVSALGTVLTINETRRHTRTITGATLNSIITDTALAWRLQWIITRQGGHASDAVNNLVRFRGAWIEYTARNLS